MRRNPKWKGFRKLTNKCYSNMIGSEEDGTCWQQAFEVLKEIVLEERRKDPTFASELWMLDDITEFDYDVEGWLEDCMDELNMKQEYGALLKICEDILKLFAWPEYSGSDYKFHIMEALNGLGREKESVEFCKKWMRDEPENILATVAAVYAYIGVKEYAEAEKLVDLYIPDKSMCQEENAVMFYAASKLYEAAGRKKEKKQIDKIVKEYDDKAREEFLAELFDFEGDDMDWDDTDFDLSDEDLPFQ